MIDDGPLDRSSGEYLEILRERVRSLNPGFEVSCIRYRYLEAAAQADQMALWRRQAELLNPNYQLSVTSEADAI